MNSVSNNKFKSMIIGDDLRQTGPLIIAWTPRFRALARGFCAPPGVVRLQICFCVVVQTGPLIIAGPAKIFLKAEQSFCFVCSRFLARHNAARLCAEKAWRGNAAQDLATEVSHSLGQIIF